MSILSDTGFIAEIQRQLARLASPKRLAHCQRTAQTARALALRFNVDPDLAFFAGLCHDCAREMPLSRQQALARQLNRIKPLDRQFPAILHGRLAAAIMQRHTGFYSLAADRAMSLHTTGGLHMQSLDKIVFIADYFEPGRPYISPEQSNMLQTESLSRICFAALEGSVHYLQAIKAAVYPDTLIWYNKLKTASEA